MERGRKEVFDFDTFLESSLAAELQFTAWRSCVTRRHELPTMTQLTKLNLAVQQLDHAISLFLKREHLISAITLAGAAEEILGKLATQAKLTPALERRTRAACALHRHLWGTDARAKTFADLKNKTRNELKHFIEGTQVEIDLEEEAMLMIDRAVENYRLLHPRRSPRVAAYEQERLRRRSNVTGGSAGIAPNNP